MALLHSPRKKHRVREKPGSLLPIATDSNKLWPDDLPPHQIYRGTYDNGSIVIWNLKWADALWHNGYFGERRQHMETDMGDRGNQQFSRKKRRKLMCVDDLIQGQLLEEEVEEKDEVNEVKVQEDWEDIIQNNEAEMKLKYGEEKEEIQMEHMETDCPKSHQEIAEGHERGSRNKGNNFDECNRDSAVERNRNEWRTMLVLGGRQTETNTTTDHSQPHLTLLPAEAFFLCYALGCLIVSRQRGATRTKKGTKQKGGAMQELTVDQLWTIFMDDDPDFASKYLVYHHYRTKGWVVKCGLKYGADWVLYPVGPPFYHAQYTVTIYSLWDNTLTPVDIHPERQLNWTSLATTERVTTHVNKTPVLCFVLRPRTVTEAELWHVKCLQQLRLQEMVVTRWSPNSES